jgi:hypothetical protein
MPNIMIDEFLLMIIIAGIGLAVAYLRAEYVVHRRFKAAEHKKLIAQRELHANRLTFKQIDVPVSALRNHQDFLSKESAIRVDLAPAEGSSIVYSREPADTGMARHRELA